MEKLDQNIWQGVGIYAKTNRACRKLTIEYNRIDRIDWISPKYKFRQANNIQLSFFVLKAMIVFGEANLLGWFVFFLC